MRRHLRTACGLMPRASEIGITPSRSMTSTPSGSVPLACRESSMPLDSTMITGTRRHPDDLFSNHAVFRLLDGSWSAFLKLSLVRMALCGLLGASSSCILPRRCEGCCPHGHPNRVRSGQHWTELTTFSVDDSRPIGPVTIVTRRRDVFGGGDNRHQMRASDSSMLTLCKDDLNSAPGPVALGLVTIVTGPVTICHRIFRPLTY